MQIKVKQGDTVLYSRVTDDPKAASRAMSFLMSAPVGDGQITTIDNGGNDFTFRNANLDVSSLIRAVEGIVVRTTRAKA